MGRLAGESGVAAAWSGLEDHLEGRWRELSREIREYPTPIARCDQQLAKLLEQRANVHERLDLMARLATRNPVSVREPSAEMVGEVLRAGAATDDDSERALRDRLREAISGPPG